MNVSNISFSMGNSVQRSASSPETSVAGAAKGPQAPAVQGPTVGGDSVTLSPLASSLRDESLTAFSALSSELRTQLSSLVEGGALTGEDVHNALKQRLKEARSSAYSASFRMANSDSADLFLDEGATSGDFQNAMRATSEKRAGMMDKLALLERVGQSESEEYAGISKQLVAGASNPTVLNSQSGAARLILNPFQGADLTESRLRSTKTEGDAAYKLKSTGFDMAALDRALRPIGERDAASIIAERTGVPGVTTVAVDREFDAEDAINKPVVLPTPAVGVGKSADGINAISGNVRAGLEAAAKLQTDPFAEALATREYQRGLKARY